MFPEAVVYTGDKIKTKFQTQWFKGGENLMTCFKAQWLILRTNFRHNSRHIGLQWGHNLDTFPVKVVLKVLIIQMFQCNIVCYFG